VRGRMALEQAWGFVVRHRRKLLAGSAAAGVVYFVGRKVLDMYAAEKTDGHLQDFGNKIDTFVKDVNDKADIQLRKDAREADEGPDPAEQHKLFEGMHSVVQNYVCTKVLADLKQRIEDEFQVETLLGDIKKKSLDKKDKYAKYEELKIAVIATAVASVHALSLLHLLFCVEISHAIMVTRNNKLGKSTSEDMGACCEKDALRTARRFLEADDCLPALLRAAKEATHKSMAGILVSSKITLTRFQEVLDATGDELWGPAARAGEQPGGEGRPLSTRMTRYLLPAFEPTEQEERLGVSVGETVATLRQECTTILRGDLTDDVLGATTRAARGVLRQKVEDAWVTRHSGKANEDTLVRVVILLRKANTCVWGRGSNSSVEAMKQTDDLQVLCRCILFAAPPPDGDAGDV